MAFHTTVITGTCKGGSGNLGSTTIVAFAFIVLHGINMLLLAIFVIAIVCISIVVVAIAIIRPIPVLFELGPFVRHIPFEGIVYDLYKVFQVMILLLILGLVSECMLMAFPTAIGSRLMTIASWFSILT